MTVVVAAATCVASEPLTMMFRPFELKPAS
jgi:hypothetical protein